MYYLLGDGDADTTTKSIVQAAEAQAAEMDAVLACQRSRQPNDYDVDCLTKGYNEAVARINALRKELSVVSPGWDMPGGANAPVTDPIKAAEIRAKIDIQSALRNRFAQIRNDVWRSGVAALNPNTATCEQVKQQSLFTPPVTAGSAISATQQAWNKRYAECFPPDPHSMDSVAVAATTAVVAAPKPPTAADVAAAIAQQQQVAPLAPRPTPAWVWAAGAGAAGILLTLLMSR